MTRKSRHNRFLLSLENLTASVICSKIGKMLFRLKNLLESALEDQNIFDNVSNPMRNELLGHLLHDVEDDESQKLTNREWMHLLGLLLNRSTLDLAFVGRRFFGLSVDDDAPQEKLTLHQLLLIVSNAAPNLQTLKISGSFLVSVEVSEWVTTDVFDLRWDSVSPMRHLSELHLSYMFLWPKQSDLSQLADKFPNLKKLQLHLQELDNEGITHLRRLSQLQHLKLMLCDSWGHQDWDVLFADILHQMPRLQLLQLKKRNGRKHHVDFSRVQGHPALQRELSLEVLHAKGGLPAVARLPLLQELSLQGLSTSNHHQLSQCTKLSSLRLDAVPAGEVLRLLDAVGHRLSTLDLVCAAPVLPLLDVLQLCPNLDTFWATNPLALDLSGPATPVLKNLKDFKLQFHGQVSPDLLKTLTLAAPSLEKLELRDVLFQQQVPDEDEGQAKKFPKLNCLTIGSHHNMDFDEVLALAQITEDILEISPRVQKVGVDFKCYSVFDLWNLLPASTIVNQINYNV